MCFNKCFKHLDSFLFIFKHKILEMSGHSTTLLFALTLYFTSPKKSQRDFGVYLQTQHKTGKCGISLLSMKISAIWEIKNLEIKKK